MFQWNELTTLRKTCTVVATSLVGLTIGGGATQLYFDKKRAKLPDLVVYPPDRWQVASELSSQIIKCIGRYQEELEKLPKIVRLKERGEAANILPALMVNINQAHLLVVECVQGIRRIDIGPLRDQPLPPPLGLLPERIRMAKLSSDRLLAAAKNYERKAALQAITLDDLKGFQSFAAQAAADCVGVMALVSND